MSQLKQEDQDLYAELLNEDEQETAEDERAEQSKSAGENEQQEEIYYSEYRRQSRVLPFLKALVVVLFIVGFIAACLVKTNDLYKEKAELTALKEDIERQISEEKAKALDYKVDKAYYSSDKYKEDMARNRFRLVYPGEFMISLIE